MAAAVEGVLFNELSHRTVAPCTYNIPALFAALPSHAEGCRHERGGTLFAV